MKPLAALPQAEQKSALTTYNNSKLRQVHAGIRSGQGQLGHSSTVHRVNLSGHKGRRI